MKCGENLPEDAKFCFKCGGKTLDNNEPGLPEKNIESEVKEDVVGERLISPLKKKPVTKGGAFVGKYRLLLAVGAALSVAVLAWMIIKGPESIEMVLIPGGTFQMGSTFSVSDDESKPRHQVTLSSFYIGKYEVTQGQWLAVMGSNPSRFQKGGNYPVEKVSWVDAQEYIRKLNQMTGKRYRLTTEAEWEYAARGGGLSRGYKYSGSDNLDEVAWYCENSGDMPLDGKFSPERIASHNLRTHQVGRKRPNELGLFDMSGNVSEWCSDWFGDYESDSQTNPVGPSTGSGRVARGGTYVFFDSLCTVSARGGFPPDDRSGVVGFRLAADSQ
jgi:formylglycine-generating enzyme required for sulfatase activity